MRQEYSLIQKTKLVDQVLNTNDSLRKIAADNNISESGLRSLLKRIGIVGRDNTGLPAVKQNPTQPKILFFDVETTAAVALAFGRHKQFINQDAIIEEGGKIITAAYRWLGQSDSTLVNASADCFTGSDAQAVEELYYCFEEADLVVGHNAKNFDIKVLQTRGLANNFDALPFVQVCDTLEVAKKKFRFPSNRLDALAAYLGIGRKIDTGGIDLWKRVQAGDKQAFKEMREYCKHDTNLLYDVFVAMRSRGLISSFNAGVYFNDNEIHCPVCSSTDVVESGRFVTTPTSKFKEYRCNDCGSVSRGRDNLISTEKRKSLLIGK